MFLRVQVHFSQSHSLVPLNLRLQPIDLMKHKKLNNQLLHLKIIQSSKEVINQKKKRSKNKILERKMIKGYSVVVYLVIIAFSVDLI